MSIRNTSLAVGEFFHIYNRGNSKQVIYKTVADYKRFQLLLYLANNTEICHMQSILKTKKNPFKQERGKQLVDIHAYCLMPNHYHLVVSPTIENGITQFMQKMGTGYSMYFNKKYERTGSLFEGKFKSKHAYTDEYLKYLFSYIHINPLALKNEDLNSNSKDDIRNNFDFLSNYQYSSLTDYIETQRNEEAILDKNMYTGYLPSHQNIYKELQDWLELEFATV